MGQFAAYNYSMATKQVVKLKWPEIVFKFRMGDKIANIFHTVNFLSLWICAIVCFILSRKTNFGMKNIHVKLISGFVNGMR